MKTIIYALKSFKVATTAMVVVTAYAVSVWVIHGDYAQDFALTAVLTIMVAAFTWFFLAISAAFIDYFKS